MKKQIIFPKQLTSKHRGLVGGKAWNLAQLQRKRFNTANFFILSNALQAKALQKGLSLDIQKEIIGQLQLMNGDKFAIRSSANFEDGNISSFAGQFDSFLSVSKSGVIEAIHACFEAVESEQVRLYCDFHGFDSQNIKMAVIIQEMVDADKGGVVFTENIEKGRENELVIEAAIGLGEQVVSGIVDPQKIVIDKDTQGVVEVINNGYKVLNDDELYLLVKTSLKIEELFGQPQDIEWVIEDSKLYILQTRPITT